MGVKLHPFAILDKGVVSISFMIFNLCVLFIIVVKVDGYS